MSTNSPADQLRAARALIDAPEKWTKGAFARNAEGSPTVYGKATCFCVVGAIDHAGYFCSEHSDLAEEAVRRSLPKWAKGGITDFNDYPTTTHADIMALFDRAITLASTGGQDRG